MDDYRSNFEGYFVEYYGDIKSKLNKLDYAILYDELPIYYLVLIEEGRLEDFLKDLPGVISIQPNYIYELSQIEEGNYEIKDKFMNLTSHYTGKGVVLGVIGDGIDYLDCNFINENGDTRIKMVWDQTIETIEDNRVSYGRVYGKKEIDEAIALKNKGEKHNNVVDYIDGNGYLTTICKTIAGSEYNSVNQCQYAIVKLKKAEKITRKMNCIKLKRVNLYETYDIVKALEYLSNLNKKIKEPMVIYVPLESNFEGRNGGAVLERFIDYFSNINKDLFFVTNNGNEGDGYRHSEGTIRGEGNQVSIPIIVGDETNRDSSERRFDFLISVWTSIYDNLSIKVISPLGEDSNPIDSSSTFIMNTDNFRSGTVEVLSMAPRLKSSEREVLIKIKNGIQGTWSIDLLGKKIIYGEYDIWLPMKELTNYNVMFRYPNKSRTLTTPSTARNVLSSMCYSRYEKDIRVLSGRPSCDIKKRTKEGFIVDSTGILIEDDYGILKIHGVAVSGCILTWLVILILQWAIVEKHKPDINLNHIRTILSISSVEHSSHDYSIIDITKLNQLLLEL